MEPSQSGLTEELIQNATGRVERLLARHFEEVALDFRQRLLPSKYENNLS